MKDLTDNELLRLTHFMSEITIKIEQFDDVTDKLPKSLTSEIDKYKAKINKERERRFEPQIITIYD